MQTKIVVKNRLKLDPRGSQSVQTAAFLALVLMAATKLAGEKKTGLQVWQIAALRSAISTLAGLRLGRPAIPRDSEGGLANRARFGFAVFTWPRRLLKRSSKSCF